MSVCEVAEQPTVADDPLMERPRASDDYVKRRAAELYMPRVARWLNDPSCERRAMEELMKIVGPNYPKYEMMRGLEQMGWCGNDELLDVLEECAECFAEALRELTWQWVRCLDIRPSLKVGDRVRIPRHFKPDDVGEVVRIDLKQAKYNVHTPVQDPTQSWVIEFERVAAVTEVDSK